MTHPNEDAPEASSASERPQIAKRQRIAKLMARAGLCSRRDAEAWIVAGRVSLNGDLLTSPAVDVSPDDTILVDGAPLPAVDKTRLFLFHKPRGLVTSDRDPEGRATVADFLREHWPDGPRVVTVGRLDINTEGLLLLTNDGGLARTLELPQTGWVRRYRVRAKGTADPAALDALAEGVTIDGIDYVGIEAKLDRVQGANIWLSMSLREGKNREIKRVLEHIGLEVNRLIRLSFGPFQLLDLSEGAVEEVRTRVLRDQLGVKLAAQAGVTFDEAPPNAAPASPAKDKAVKLARAERGTRSSSPRPDGGPQRQRRTEAEAPSRRERPTRGARKHVSALRAERSESERSTPRTRIERTATTDRHARSVAVERLVRPQAETAERRRIAEPKGTGGRRPARSDDRRRDDDRKSEHRRGASAGSRPLGRAQRRARPDGDADARRGTPGATCRTRHTSPSAAGKRERIARSGPRRDDRTQRDDTREGPRGGRRDRASPGRRDDHAPRRDRDDRPPRKGLDERRGPRVERSSEGKRRPKSPGPGRAAEAPRGERSARKKPSGDRPRGPSKPPRR